MSRVRDRIGSAFEADPRICLSAFTASLTILFIEVAYFQQLTFLTSYLRASSIIALALLGIAAGGLLGFLLSRWSRTVAAAGLLLLAPSVLLAFAHTMYEPDAYVRNAIVMTVPFLLGAMVVSLSFTAEKRTNMVYAFDLAGAGIGALLAALTVPVLREEGSVVLIAIVATVAVPFAVPRNAGRWFRRALVVLSLLLLAGEIAMFSLHLAVDPFNMVLVAGKVEDRSLREKIYNVREQRGITEDNLYSKGSLIERTDLFLNPKINYWLVVYNGRVNDHTSHRREYRYDNDRRIPIPLFRDRNEAPEVMVIGTSIEGVCKTAKHIAGDHGNVTGLEYKPGVVELVLEDQTKVHQHGQYFYEGIDLHVVDARTFLARTDKRFDLITMMNTHRVRTIGAEGPPEFLHTVEAVESYLDHLTPKGAVVIEERTLNPDADAGTHRYLATIARALRNRGLDPAEHVIVYETYVTPPRWSFFRRRGITPTKDGYTSRRYAFIVIFREPVVEDEEARSLWTNWKRDIDQYIYYSEGCSKKKDHCSRPIVDGCVKKFRRPYQNYDLVRECVSAGFEDTPCKCDYRKGMLDLRVRHSPWEDIDTTYSKAICDPHPEDLLADKGYWVGAATDDRPFITDVDNQQPMVDEIVDSTAVAGAVFFFPPLLILGVILARQSLRRRESSAAPGGSRVAQLVIHGTFCGVVGVAFILIEMVLMQWFSVFMGSPAASLALILPAMLIMSGIGGAISSKFGIKRVLVVLVLIAALVVLFRFVITDLLNLLIVLPMAARIVAMLVLTAPLFVLMGVPFSFALREAYQNLSPGYPALFFGINGAMGALAMPLSLKLTMVYGFNFTLLVGAGLYVVLTLLLAIHLPFRRRS
jgi:hypothetical protein